MTIDARLAAAAAKPYVTASELALLTSFSVYTIRRATRAGRLPTLRVRGSIRYPRAEAIRAMREPSQHVAGASSIDLKVRETADV
jgi:hypothetical protein